MRRRLKAPALSLSAEIKLTWLGIAVTVSAFAAFAVSILQSTHHLSAPLNLAGLVLYLALVATLVYGGLVYLTTRAAYLRRLLRDPAPPASVRFEDPAESPPLVALIPSYREEPEVIRQALLSAALQQYPNRRVVLLIDDPPDPREPADLALLEAARALPGEITAMLAEPRQRAAAAVASYRAQERLAGTPADTSEPRRLADHYNAVAAWFERLVADAPAGNHTSRLFTQAVLAAQAREHRQTAVDLCAPGTTIGWSRIDALYGRLEWLFAVEIVSFERKRYANLSSAENKAMNLNSYIQLIGSRYDERATCAGLRLERQPQGAQRVPDADYVLTLDADSLVLPHYAGVLVSVMETKGNERIAVAQVPYSAVQGPVSTLERLAGATTDMQHMIHQGFTAHNATYWVGANALLRKRALDDIVVDVRDERGLTVRKFIQDRTVIEDTESSVDLILRGWRLHNHLERLSFSATPPDYGALIIQRRRWANGGLLILPKLVRYIAHGAWTVSKVQEAALRLHYLTSVAAANLACLLLILAPLPDWLASYWLPLAALPYFLLYGRDMKRGGYRRFDVIRVYALNLLLLAACLGGVCKSLHQAVTGRQTAFKRTPKVAGRTAAPAMYIAAPVSLAIYLIAAVGWDLTAGRWIHAAIAALTATMLAYALVALVGIRAALEDVISSLHDLRRRAPRWGPIRLGPRPGLEAGRRLGRAALSGLAGAAMVAGFLTLTVDRHASDASKQAALPATANPEAPAAARRTARPRPSRPPPALRPQPHAPTGAARSTRERPPARAGSLAPRAGGTEPGAALPVAAPSPAVQVTQPSPSAPTEVSNSQNRPSRGQPALAPGPAGPGAPFEPGQQVN